MRGRGPHEGLQLTPLAAVVEPDRADDSSEAQSVRAELDRLLTSLVELGGSDLHLTAGIAPCMRVLGSLAPVPDYDMLTPVDTRLLVRSFITEAQWERFENEQELDTAYSVPDVSRFRVNVYRQRGSVGAAFRAIPNKIQTLAELGLPEAVREFARLPRGLVLVTGPTGSGKSTTLASVLDVINRTRSGHIITIEDPIEFVHSHKKCVVNQREVGTDTADFAVALKHALRQDPDVILVGELRDFETTSVAVTAAETGHLVLATLHTQSAAQTVDRIIDIFPPTQQQQIRTQLASCLQGVVTQALVPRSDFPGRTAVCEVMIATPAIRNLIREGKVHQIQSFLQSSGEVGMISFDQHLAMRYAEHVVSRNTALGLAQDPDEFTRLTKGA
jgi:twitching motility protein PilT